MNLLENDIKNIIMQNYDVSIGHCNETSEIDVHQLNDGIVATQNIRANNITHCSIIPEWQENMIYMANTFWRYESSIYVLLYSPGTISIYPPSGKLKANTILDDNHVWKYVCDIDYIVKGDYVVPKPTEEIVRRGTISSVDVIMNSNHPITTFKSFSLNPAFMHGRNVIFSVEQDQNTFLVSDILIQDGGTEYQDGDLFILTDSDQAAEDQAIVDVYVEDGQVKLSAFTNGQNYSYIDIIIIGDGQNASVTFSSVAGVLTNVAMANMGSDYTWAKAIVLNSEKYVLGRVNVEPLNGYNSDLVRHIGPNKYIISMSFKTDQEINYYGIHRKRTLNNKFIFFDNIYFIDEFVPEADEEVTVRLLLGN